MFHVHGKRNGKRTMTLGGVSVSEFIENAFTKKESRKRMTLLVAIQGWSVEVGLDLLDFWVLHLIGLDLIGLGYIQS